MVAHRLEALDARGGNPTIAFLARGIEGLVVRVTAKAPTAGEAAELVAAEERGDMLSEDELLAACILLLVAGNETTTNLIGNGIEVMPQQGAVRVATKVVDKSWVRLDVGDTGPGIPAEYQEIIFRKFEQVHAQHAPRVRSSGLGLTFCRLATEAHGGRIWGESEVGRGSTFSFTLPRAAAPDPALQPA